MRQADVTWLIFSRFKLLNRQPFHIVFMLDENTIFLVVLASCCCNVKVTILYCIRVKKCSLNEVQAYLLYRYGLGMAKRKMSEHALYHCKKRAEEIAEEQNGRLD